MDDVKFRSELVDVRKQLNETRAVLMSLESREKVLRSAIKQKTERCQVCLGSGKVPERDCFSGYTVLEDCRNCRGTGLWEEPM